MNLWLRLLWILVAARRGPRCDPTAPVRLAFRVLPSDLDLNLHLTNSRYLSFMDLGRMNLLSRSRLWPVLRREGWAPVIGGCMVQFRRPLGPFELSTTIRGWDERWLYIEHRMTTAEGLACLAMVRGAFLRGGKVIPPEEIALRGGFHGQRTEVPESLRAAWQGFRAATA